MISSKKYFMGIMLLILFIPSFIIAQDNVTSNEKVRKNEIGVYFGMVEYNLHYERNILQLPKSHFNIRAGYGYWSNLTKEGNYYNLALVHLIGRRSSLLELNLGVKYVLETAFDKDLVLPDVYAGYRYSNPNKMLVLRAGFSITSWINVGLGLKF